MKKKTKQQYKKTAIRLRELIIIEIIGAVVSGLIAGAVHLAFDNFHLANKVENVCDILKQKDQASCKKAIDTIMNATEDNIENYTVDLK